jgi:hypothetical protein
MTPRQCEDSLVLSFEPALDEAQQEGYVCFAFDARTLEGAPIERLIWSTTPGGVVLHHATLLATAEARPTNGGFDCDPMPPDAIALHVLSPAGDELELPEGVALDLPDETQTLLIEAHIRRVGTENSSSATLEVCRATAPPTHLAARIGIAAPVPAIRPNMVERASARCQLSKAWNLVSVWPHMHRVGSEFHAALFRGAERIPIVDVAHWDFNHQLTYPVELSAEPGDLIETTCVWSNPTSDYVLPGIYTENEMCTFGVIGWPASAANCKLE